MNATIALLTDFGVRDAYVGIMKGVMQRINPAVSFIDITHDIQPQNVRQAAFALLNCYRYFQTDTIFLVVVDPGVGGTRKPIAAQAGDYTFVAPDNGVLSYVLNEFDTFEVVELSNLLYQLSPVSNTFHGRDIFAPAAAHLSSGVALYKFGATVEHIYKQLLPHIKIENSQITGQVLYADHFGNLVTTIGNLTWTDAQHLKLTTRFGDSPEPIIIPVENSTLSVKDITLSGIHHTYSEVERHQLLILVGSNGFLEIAMNQGNAAHHLDISPGSTIILQIG